MAQVSFKDLKIMADAVKVDYSLLLDDSESRQCGPNSQTDEISEKEWDKLHALQILVNELYKLRPLPF